MESNIFKMLKSVKSGYVLTGMYHGSIIHIYDCMIHIDKYIYIYIQYKDMKDHHQSSVRKKMKE